MDPRLIIEGFARKTQRISKSKWFYSTQIWLLGSTLNENVNHLGHSVPPTSDSFGGF